MNNIKTSVIIPALNGASVTKKSVFCGHKLYIVLNEAVVFAGRYSTGKYSNNSYLWVNASSLFVFYVS